MNADIVYGSRWVSARAACSLGRVFDQIKLDVEEDVKARMALRSAPPYYVFEVSSTTDRLTVSLSGNKIDRKSVRFELYEKSIISEDMNGVKTEATLTLNDLGECRLKVNNQEWEFWRFRRTALEGLFFETTDRESRLLL